MDKVVLTPLTQIFHSKGNIYHALKASEESFTTFGEAYFSTINKDDIKGWKKHTTMVLNLVVPIGKIKFIFFDEKINEFFEIELSQDNYQRLTVQAGIWMSFQGLEVSNMLLNLASIEHNPCESITKELNEISYEW